METKLANGKIPPYTECPYKSDCIHADNTIAPASCKHKGKEHPVEYSCATARSLEIMVRTGILEKGDSDKC